MRKTIKIGEKEFEFEANLGTADLYQSFTGENLFEKLASFKGIKTDAPEAWRVLDVYKRMMYVMNVQATHSEIKEMRARMNEDSYLEWTFQFSPSDINLNNVNEIVKLWQSTRETHSTPKNP